MSETHAPAFQIERGRNGQWTSHLVASNGEITWNSEQFTTLGKAEESLFHLVDEALEILAPKIDEFYSLDGAEIPTVSAIPYELSVAYTRGDRDYEPRVAHRPAA